MDRAAAIEVEDLSKTFRVPRERFHTLKERALHPLRRTPYDELRILRDVSFRVDEGEFFGIVGRNGSGKSTLLKCMAGIYRADRGHIRVTGRLAPFIELGVGFNPDLTARENVIINAVMMGLTPREARARFDDVIAFAELEPFLDLKLKNYSSGMQVRLAFAVMVQADADVLLVDEVLAVGDAAFQQKCFDVFHRLRREGRTIVLVTHDMELVERFCHRALLLSDGDVVAAGEPVEVARRYLAENFAEGGAAFAGSEHARVSIDDVWVGHEGAAAPGIPHGQPAELHARLTAHEPVPDPQVTLWLTNEAGVRVCSFAAREEGEPLEVAFYWENRLTGGRFTVGCSVARGATGAELLAVEDQVAEVVVYGSEHAQGVVALPYESLVRRGAPTQAAR